MLLGVMISANNSITALKDQTALFLMDHLHSRICTSLVLLHMLKGYYSSSVVLLHTVRKCTDPEVTAVRDTRAKKLTQPRAGACFHREPEAFGTPKWTVLHERQSFTIHRSTDRLND